MIDYKIIKNCRMCRKRFVVHKVDAKKIFCKECEPKANKWYKKQYEK